MPLVTIAIPASRPEGFARALRSALSQQYEPLEVLVYDDSADDVIAGLVEQIRGQSTVALRYVRSPAALGLANAVQQCVELATGEFVKILHDEDWLFENHVSRLVPALQQCPDVWVAACQRYMADPQERILPTRVENASYIHEDVLMQGGDILSLLEANPIDLFGSLSCLLMRRVQLLAVLQALASDPAQSFSVTLDFIVLICLLRRGNLVLLNEVLATQRLDPARVHSVANAHHRHAVELGTIVKLLKARGAKVVGTSLDIRYVTLKDLPALEAQRVYEPLPLIRQMGVLKENLKEYIGDGARTFDDVYEQWVASKNFTEGQKLNLPERVAGWPRQTRFVVVIVDERPAAQLHETLASVEQQSYPAVASIVISSACHETRVEGTTLYAPLTEAWPQQVNALLAELDGFDWFYLLRSGDCLHEHALLLMAERIAQDAVLQACYSDEDCQGEAFLTEPVFKPDFNLDLLRSYPYVGRLLAFSRDRFLAVSGFDPEFGELGPHDLLWKIVEGDGTAAVGHIAQVLVHCRQSYSSWLSEPGVQSASAMLVSRHLDRIGLAHTHLPVSPKVVNRLQYHFSEQPLVSIVIVSDARLAHLQNCLDSLLEKTDYPTYEVIVIPSLEESAPGRAWLDGIASLGSEQLRVCWAPHGLVEYAQRANYGASLAKGDYVLLLSQDAGIIDPVWLSEMMMHVQRNEVAAVGAKLYNQAGTVEHAGLVFGLGGLAGSVSRGEQPSSAGYMQRLIVVHNYSAVSRHCLLADKTVWAAIGGLDENLRDISLEVDLCLRMRQAGYLTVFTPFARLLLRAAETLSAANSASETEVPEAQRAVLRKWMPDLARDPAYNPNLSLASTGFNLAGAARNSWLPFESKIRTRILGLPVNKGAVGHYRLINPFGRLENAGMIEGALYYRTPQVVEIERMVPDVIIFQGRYTEGPVEGIKIIKESIDAFTIFELDDYLLNVPDQNEHKRYIGKSIAQSLPKGIGLCDRLVVSTEPLAHAMRGMNDDIRVVPNMLAPQLWEGLHSARGTSRKPRVGWGGGTSHTGDLLLIADVVKALAKEVDWVFFGMCPAELRPYIHEFHETVTLDRYPAKLASLNLDLALAPLEQVVFNDCKSNLRLLEYGACGYPVICSDTLAYQGALTATRVKDNSASQWLAAIRMHLSDRQANARLGDELKAQVMRDFVLHGAGLQRWLSAWQP